MDEENLLKKKSKKSQEPKVEIPVIKAYELLQEMSYNYDDLEVVPKKKQNKIKALLNKNSSKFGIGFAVFLFAIFGVSYSYFNYTKTDPRQADIAAGEVYVRLVENASNISLSTLYPRTNAEARSRNDNYFDFTIKSKNTSSDKSILYSIGITNGSNITGKTRIDPQYIKVDLQEKVNNEYKYIQEAVSLSGYSFTGIVPTDTNSEITREYRIRFWISDKVLISDTDPNASYTESEFSNLYANFNVSVNSEDKYAAYGLLNKNALVAQIDFGEVSSSTNGEGLYVLYGTEDDTNPIYYYRGDVDNNNVIFGDFCWQIIRTTNTGGIKMIYNGDVTGNGTTCEKTLLDSRQTSQTEFNVNHTSMSDVGYMHNQRYAFAEGVTTGAIYGRDIEWNGTSYLVIDNTPNTASTNTTKDDDHHYSCGTNNGTSCTSVRYYHNGDDYIVLTDGDFVDDAIYKMTGNGSDEVKLRNSGYVLNQNDSEIKEAVEDWFEANLTNVLDSSQTDYRPYIEDTIFCNDRSFQETGHNSFGVSGWNKNGGDLDDYIHFGTFNRLRIHNWYSTTNVPVFTCPNETDRFSVSNSAAHLKYPVGLLTADELVLAGAAGNDFAENMSLYLYFDGVAWTMSPCYYGYADGFTLGGSGSLDSDYVISSYSVRPVISLKAGVSFANGGDGTPTNPYVVEYN